MGTQHPRKGAHQPTNTVRGLRTQAGSVCYNAGVLWPNGWIDQNSTWYIGVPRPRLHCVRWEPSSPTERAQQPPNIVPVLRAHVGQSASLNCGPCLLWRNGRPSQQLLISCCTADGRESLYFTVGRIFHSKLPLPTGDLDPHLIHDSPGVSEPTTQTASRADQPFLHNLAQSVPILYKWPRFGPSKFSLPMGVLYRHLIYDSVAPPESFVQTASRSVEPFFCTAH